MSRTRVLTPDVVAAIQERRRAGVPSSEIERQFGISHGSVVNAMKASPSSALGAPTHPEPSDDPQAVPPDPSDLTALLRRQVSTLETLAETAKATKDVAAFASISRVLNATTALLAKMTPPPPPDPNANPDFVALAKKAREKLHALVDRALAELE